MSSGQRIRTIASVLVMGMLASCAGSSLGDSVQQSLEADPQLEETTPLQAEKTAVTDATEEEPEVTAATDSPNAAADNREQDATEIATAPKPGDADFVGPVWTNPSNTATTVDTASGADSPTSGDLNLSGVPADLQPYIQDLRQLGVIAIASAANNEDAATSPYNQPISRQEYARWLFDSYNAIYADEPGERLRAGSSADEPAFQDVSPTNPAYAEIQGLAEAGIIPSAFTGNSTDVNFRPDAPLTRADLILWKIPLDTQAALPTTTPEAVTQAWGFQDTGSIDPMALRAIAADFQLGDFANIRRAFGYTTLFRPDKTVSRAEAAAVLWRFGTPTEGYTAAEPQTQNASTMSEE